jgi:hypothetical protein
MLNKDDEVMKHTITELGVGERRGRGKFAGSRTPPLPPEKRWLLETLDIDGT